MDARAPSSPVNVGLGLMDAWQVSVGQIPAWGARGLRVLRRVAATGPMRLKALAASHPTGLPRLRAATADMLGASNSVLGILLVVGLAKPGTMCGVYDRQLQDAMPRVLASVFLNDFSDSSLILPDVSRK